MAEIAIERVFSTPGVSPFDQVTWVKHDVVLTDYRTGEVTFEQRGVEFPEFWDTTAVNIVTSKYFYGQLGAHNREASLRTLIERVVGAYLRGGITHRYWAEGSENAEIFYDELCYLLLHQMFSFNSPVWFNVGTPGDQQVSACFILDVEDNIPSILNWFTEEGLIFKNGSGAGCNLSKIRGSREAVTGGGTASGPVSFMRGADSVAGMVKSGGKTRRAAKMVVLDDDHPDILEFVRIKVEEEKKIRALRDAGFDMSVGGADVGSVQYQNANNSVMLSDSFMQAVMADGLWHLINRVTGTAAQTIKARDLMREIAQSAWACGDPGVMFSDNINDMNTLKDVGKIRSSNPCLRGDTVIPTRGGLTRISDWADARDTREVWDGTEWVRANATLSGYKPTVELKLSTNRSLFMTADHKVSSDGVFVEAGDMADRGLDALPTPEGYGFDEVAITTVLEVVPTGLVEPVYDFHMEKTHSACVSGYRVHNCGEYLSVANSSCNLGSINLMKFYDRFDGFDYCGFRHAVRVAIIAMDISCSFGDFPLPKIEENTRKYRQLGLGYANLGALLMSMAHPYDSDGGRKLAAEITEEMTFQAYSTSRDLAKVYGPYAGWEESKDGLLDVLGQHRVEAESLDVDNYGPWEELIESIREYGVRNCQVTLLAPTGTIGLAMGCSTTGIEPAFSLTSYKKTVTGDVIELTIPEVENAMWSLGMTELDPTGKVFATANGENAIEPMGHIRMMAAVQPFLSAGISKTVNLPESATVEDIERVYMEGWRLGLKAVAVYRDGSKTSQPMSVKADASEETPVEAYVGDTSTRRKLPKKRRGYTHSFSVAGTEGYLTTGEHEDGSLGEIFLTVSKAGSTLNGLLDAVAVLTSIGLQYGVPLETLVDKFSGTKYAPAGLTDDRDVRMSSSLLDYIFRRLELDYLSDDFDVEGSEEVAGIALEAAAPQTGITTGEICSICGGTLQRSGSCHVCTSCGSTTGCS